MKCEHFESKVDIFDISIIENYNEQIMKIEFQTGIFCHRLLENRFDLFLCSFFYLISTKCDILCIVFFLFIPLVVVYCWSNTFSLVQKMSIYHCMFINIKTFTLIRQQKNWFPAIFRGQMKIVRSVCLTSCQLIEFLLSCSSENHELVYFTYEFVISAKKKQ